MRIAAAFAFVLCMGSMLISAPSSDQQAGPCYLTVHVPVGASLDVNGQRTQQMTAVRKFVSPPLPVGETFYYTFTATYTSNGKPVSKRRQVAVTANATIDVDMPGGETLQFEKPKPPVPQTPFATPAESSPRRPAQPPAAPKVEAPQKPEKPIRPEIEVPYVPTPRSVVAEMLKTANVKEGDVVYDLGCGDGRIVIAAVKDFKAKRGLGIDFNPERVKESKQAAKEADVEDKVEFRQGDVLKLTEKDFEDVDVVTLYLLPEVNRMLKPVLRKGLKAGARVVSHDFDMGDDWEPEKTITVLDPDGNDHTVYLWTIPKKK